MRNYNRFSQGLHDISNLLDLLALHHCPPNSVVPRSSVIVENLIDLQFHIHDLNHMLLIPNSCFHWKDQMGGRKGLQNSTVVAGHKDYLIVLECWCCILRFHNQHPIIQAVLYKVYPIPMTILYCLELLLGMNIFHHECL